MAGKRQMPPIHPGEILRQDVLPALNITVSEAAEKSIGGDVAVRFVAAAASAAAGKGKRKGR